MKSSIAPLRLGVMFGAVLFLLAGLERPLAQAAMATNTVETSAPDSNLQAELLQAYVRLQAQLNDAQMAIEKNRAENEKSAREQAAVISDKLSAIQAALEADRTRQQEELRKSNQTLLWVAGVFGCAGMLAMLFTAMFQWRTMNRVTEMSAWRPQLAAGSSNPLLPAGTDLSGGKVVELSNQRLMAVIERLEQRVFELEHGGAAPGTAVPAEAGTGSADDQSLKARINTLLGSGQSFLNEDQAEKALVCYNEILELDARHPEALVKKGAALERLKQDEEALRCYDRAIEADRTLTIAYLYKGGIYNRLERYNEALECYEQALRVQAPPA